MDIYGQEDKSRALNEQQTEKSVIQPAPGSGNTAGQKKTAVALILCAAAVFALVFAGGSLLKQKLKAASGQLAQAGAFKKVAAGFYREKEYSPDTYVLEGVICDGEQSYAIINGKVVRLHEQIDGLELIKIESSKAELKNSASGKILTLSL